MMWPMLRPHFNFIANLSDDSNLCPICGGLSLAKPVKMYFYKMRFRMRDNRCIQLSRWGVRWIFFFLYMEHYYSFHDQHSRLPKLGILVVKVRQLTKYKEHSCLSKTDNISLIFACNTTCNTFLHILETWYCVEH